MIVLGLSVSNSIMFNESRKHEGRAVYPSTIELWGKVRPMEKEKEIIGCSCLFLLNAPIKALVARTLQLFVRRGMPLRTN